jgi:hypothetical protein
MLHRLGWVVLKSGLDFTLDIITVRDEILMAYAALSLSLISPLFSHLIEYLSNNNYYLRVKGQHNLIRVFDNLSNFFLKVKCQLKCLGSH